MTPPTRPDTPVEQLVRDCLEAWEARGPGAVDELLAARPDVADAVRARLEVLGRLGMLEEAPDQAPPERFGS